MNRFDPVKMGLDGYALVEASAGTGKTYGIISLYIRLIMEEGLLPGQILVVTFTKAATEELVMKIRERMERALNYLLRDDPEEDQFLTSLVTRLTERSVTRDTLIQRVKQAMLRLDEAAIFTIHGFCQRMLREFAIEAASPLDKEVIPSEEKFRQDAYREFCRSVLYKLEEKYLRVVEKVLGISGKDRSIAMELYARSQRLLTLPHPRIVPELTLEQGLDILDKRASTLYEIKNLYLEHGSEAKKLIQECVDGVIDRFLAPLTDLDLAGGKISPDLARKKMCSRLEKLLKNMEKHLAGYDPADDYESDGLWLRELAPEKLLETLWNAVVTSKAKGLKELDTKTRQEIGHRLSLLWEENSKEDYDLSSILFKNPFCKRVFEFLDEFYLADKKFLAALLRDAKDFALEYVREKKAVLSVISYDDMILGLHDALLKKESGKGMAKRIKSRFRAALIDEFQDTDPLQWDIFSIIYPRPDKDRLYLIGDPKQAIYGFRGADIFTYLKAKQRVPAGRHFSLQINWRSNPELIETTNSIFGSDKKAFILEGIKYSPVHPKPDGHEWVKVHGEGDTTIGMELWVDPGKNLIPPLTAKEISRLILLGKSGKAFIYRDDGTKESLEAGHIAVLVHSFWEAENIRSELVKLDIPAVYYGRSSIFKSPEAPELLYILNAVISPADQRAVATALGTVTLGFKADEIASAKKSPEKWDRIVDEFVELKRIWQDRGVLPMLMGLFHRFNVPRRLLGLKGGERSLTNLRQLAELLSNEEKEHPGAERLILWLKENITNTAMEDEEHQLRLETDEDVVKIMTYHRSKGLEFPVVFLPYLDLLSLHRNTNPTCYYSEEHETYVYDCLSGEDNGNKIQYEQAYTQGEAEIMRIIYVALTRARCRVYLPLKQGGYISNLIAVGEESSNDMEGEIIEVGMKMGTDKDDPEQVRLKALGILGHGRGISCLLIDELKERYSGLSLDKGPCSGTREPAAPPAHITRKPLAPWSWRQISFSSMESAIETYGHENGSEDAISAIFSVPQEEEKKNLDIFSFPRGPRAGNCIHALFENLSFNADHGTIEEQALYCLKAFAMGEEWAGILASMARRVLDAELGMGIRLRDLDPRMVAKEMPFYISITRDHIHNHLHLFPGFQEGIIKGFIDLTFVHNGLYYLVDYKSNWLGQSPSDYSDKAMKEAMDQHNYWLQAAIYLRAVERFLEANAPKYADKRVAGIFYLFVRGIGTDKDNGDCGIFSIDPDRLKEGYPELFSLIKREKA